MCIHFDQAVLEILNVFSMEQGVTMKRAKELLRKKFSTNELSFRSLSFSGFLAGLRQDCLLEVVNKRRPILLRKYRLTKKGFLRRDFLKWNVRFQKEESQADCL